MNSDSEKAPTENRVHALWARLRRAASSIDGSVWAVWIIAICTTDLRANFPGQRFGRRIFGFQYLPGLVFHHSFDLAQAAPQWTAIIGRETTGLAPIPSNRARFCSGFRFICFGLFCKNLALVPVWESFVGPCSDAKTGANSVRTDRSGSVHGRTLGVCLPVCGESGFCSIFCAVTLAKRQRALRPVRQCLQRRCFWYLTTQPLYQHATAFFAVTMLVDL